LPREAKKKLDPGLFCAQVAGRRKRRRYFEDPGTELKRRRDSGTELQPQPQREPPERAPRRRSSETCLPDIISF
jgi:hypothetical protein